MPAEQAEVVGQDVAVELVAELSAESATADATGQAAEDGARDRADGDADGTCDRSNGCASLSTSHCSTDATCSTADGADCSGDLHGVVEGSDFWGVTARAVQ